MLGSVGSSFYELCYRLKPHKRGMKHRQWYVLGKLHNEDYGSFSHNLSGRDYFSAFRR